MSSSWTPRKYQGAFVGLGLKPGLALSASGALKSIENNMIKASRVSPTATSRISRFGIDDTDSLEGMCTTYLGGKVFQRLVNAYPLILIEDFS